MHLSWRIARRYLFAKKSTNAINLITGIAVFGIAVGTAALILVLSVFNGFEDLITGMYSNFNPDIRITARKGKTFKADSVLLGRVRAVEGVEAVSATLEEVAYFEYKDRSDFGMLKGVDEHYRRVTSIDSTIREGQYRLQDGGNEFAVLGFGMRLKLSVNIEDLFAVLNVYMLKRRVIGPFEKQFRSRFVYPTASFFVQQDFDNQYVLTSIGFARELLGLPDAASALELKVMKGWRKDRVMNALHAELGDGFVVKDKFEQQEAFMRLMKLEKWMSFAIVGLVLLLVAFNLIGALWMMVLEKRKDISILKSMGANNRMVRDVFLQEGLLISILGMGIGFVLAIGIYLLQVRFGLIGIPGDFIIDAYPISMRFFDFVVVALTVTAIGLLASLPPAKRAEQVPTVIREE